MAQAMRCSGNTVGNIRRLGQVHSPELGNHRDVHVYLPPSYANSGRHYPVVYMHDGQNLFDHAMSFAGEWGVDETLERIAHEGVEAIVVGVPNMGAARTDEYSPYRDDRLGGGHGDAYLRFLTDTLKPLVDAAVPHQAGARAHGPGGLVDGRAHQPVWLPAAARRVRLCRRDEPVALVRARRDLRRRASTCPRGMAGSISTPAPAKAAPRCARSGRWCGCSAARLDTRGCNSAMWKTAAPGTTKPPGRHGSSARFGGCCRGSEAS